MRFGLTTDFRNPPGSGKSSAMAYAEIIELFIWAETLGFGAAYIFEHHFTDDDYISSPMMAATAIAARTKHMRVGPDIAILPLYDPVRVAEDGAVLDLISNGRFDFGVGLGYRPQEYAGYGLDISRNGARVKRGVADHSLAMAGRDCHLPWQAFQCRWRQALAPPGPAAESAHLGWRLQPRRGAPRRPSWRWLRRTLESDGLRNVSRGAARGRQEPRAGARDGWRPVAHRGGRSRSDFRDLRAPPALLV